MNIELLNDPFPHVISKNFYTEEEVESIKEELKFLTNPKKLFLPGIHHGALGFGGLTASRALHLERAYNIQELSNILQVTKKSLDEPLVTTIVNVWPSFLRLKFVDLILTKVRYYHNNEEYAAHTDVSHDFLSFSYFHNIPKKFTGGELYFPQFNYEIDCSNNTFILFPGYIEHGVKRVIIENDDYWEGNGRYCISQFLSVKNKEFYE